MVGMVDSFSSHVGRDVVCPAFENPLAIRVLAGLAEDLGISMGRAKEVCPDAFVRGLRRGYVLARRTSFLYVLQHIPQKERRPIGLAFRRGLEVAQLIRILR